MNFMYICLCNTVNDKKLRDFVENHQDMCRKQSVRKIYNAIVNDDPKCGKCLPDFKKIIDTKLTDLGKEVTPLTHKPKK